MPNAACPPVSAIEEPFLLKHVAPLSSEKTQSFLALKDLFPLFKSFL